ncbi:MAG: DUF2950 domain-containing protein [Desulfobacteraceae bacterium]|nr:DUF2950 domain-containing protein [Desulfobacteraceae bacterium]
MKKARSIIFQVVKQHAPMKAIQSWATVILLLVIVLVGTGATPKQSQKGFASPEAAVSAFISALRANDPQQLLAIFGSAGQGLFSSGDAVSDRLHQEKFIAAFDLKNGVAQEGAQMILNVGENSWPFPIPIVKKGSLWYFDTLAGKEEVLNRRIGQNELSTIQTLLAVVDAQREYAMMDPDNDGIRGYAAKFGSDAGRKNGLFWKTAPGEPASPLGELVAEAYAEGYTYDGAQKEPTPFHGYYFRMLTRQGRHAPGGAYDYLVNNKMIGGFAVVAYPAIYGNSGVMTFIVNHDGVVYQKDLGPKSAQSAKAMTAFDPDKTWKKVK